jgi:hypothetical protein
MSDSSSLSGMSPATILSPSSDAGDVIDVAAIPDSSKVGQPVGTSNGKGKKRARESDVAAKGKPEGEGEDAGGTGKKAKMVKKGTGVDTQHVGLLQPTVPVEKGTYCHQ